MHLALAHTVAGFFQPWNAAPKDAKASSSKKAKDSKNAKAKAPAGPPPRKFWIVNKMRANPALMIFLPWPSDTISAT
jgi:hypothetical protein